MNMDMDKDTDTDIRTFKMPDAGLSGIQSVRYWNGKKLTIPELVRYRTKPTQSCIFWVRSRTELMDAGMPMPMPSYDQFTLS